MQTQRAFLVKEFCKSDFHSVSSEQVALLKTVATVCHFALPLSPAMQTLRSKHFLSNFLLDGSQERSMPPQLCYNHRTHTVKSQKSPRVLSEVRKQRHPDDLPVTFHYKKYKIILPCREPGDHIMESQEHPLPAHGTHKEIFTVESLKTKQSLAVKEFSPLHNSFQPYVTGHKLDSQTSILRAFI